MSDLKCAISIIDEFLKKEYADTWEEDFSDLSHIDLAIEPSEDDLTYAVATADLINCRIDLCSMDDDSVVLIRRQQFGSLREMIEKALLNLDPQELVKVTDEEFMDLDRKMTEAFVQSMETNNPSIWKDFCEGRNR